MIYHYLMSILTLVLPYVNTFYTLYYLRIFPKGKGNCTLFYKKGVLFMTFGDTLRRLRESRKISVNQLALYSGISAAQISRIETNKRGNPKPETIKKIASALKYSYEDLLAEAGYIQHENDMEIKEDYVLSEEEKEALKLFNSLSDEAKEWMMRTEAKEWLIHMIEMMQKK